MLRDAVARLDDAFHRMGIEPSERALSGWAVLCFGLLGAAAFGLLNVAETLFLKRVGVESLPWALLASAVLLVRWMVTPSAIGSLNGTPISIASATVATRRRRSGKPWGSGNPAVR